MTANDDPEWALALSYAPADRRAALQALFALDSALGQVLRTTREPMVGQMRLAWWREALERLDAAPPPAEPVLQALAAEVLPRGVSGKTMSKIVDGWEQLLASPIDVFALQRHAVLRGAHLFELGAKVCGGPHDHRTQLIGRGWAFADVATNLSDATLAKTASAMAIIRFPWPDGLPWSLRLRWYYRFQPRPFPSALRVLSAIGLIAWMNLGGRSGPKRVARLAWHRLTGR